MKPTRFRTGNLLQVCVLCGLVWSLTVSFETFDPSKYTELLDDRTIFGKSYLDCVDSCKNTIDCTGISYLRRQLRCRNHFVSDAMMKKCSSYVLSMKSEWRHKNGECMCPARKECNNGGECVFSGCTKLQEPAHGKLYGNMIDIGAKGILECNPGYVLNQPGALVCKAVGQWSGEIPVCIDGGLTVCYYVDPECTQSLVDRVGDDQLSQSSYWCDTTTYCENVGIPDGMTAKYARLTSSGYITGSWSAVGNGNHEYIQVDFREQSVISGTLLKGRDYFAGHPQQYVTKFRLLISPDCSTFEAIKDESGEDKIFDGNTRPEEPHNSETVNRSLGERVRARCVRINPTEYNTYTSLRFDVLGC